MTTEPRPSVTRFVTAIVRAEVVHGGDVHDPEIAQRMTMRLHQGLVKLVGRTGFEVLLARAIVLARRTHPILARVTAGPGGTLAGLDDAACRAGKPEECATAIVSHFIELLVVLVGEDLAMRLVVDLWPAADQEEGAR